MQEQPLKEEIRQGRQAESALHKGELQFRRLLEKLPAAAYTCDPEGLITYFNQYAVQLWGRAPKLNDPVDRFCGSFKLLWPDGSPIAHDQCWMALTLKMDKEYNGHEIVVERPDGQRLTVLAHANPIHDESGKLLGAVNVLVDITERKRAEEAHSRLAAIVESSDDAIIGKTLEGLITCWNRGAQRIYGYSAEEAVGKPISILVPPNRSDEVPAILKKVRRGERVDHYETERLKKDGTKIDVSITVSPIRDSVGIVGASTIARDFTERKRAEEKIQRLNESLESKVEERTAELEEALAGLKESEERFRNTFEEAAIGMAVGELDGRHTQVNTSLCEMLGYSEEELLATTFLAITHPDDLGEDLEYMRRMMEGEVNSFQTEKRCLHGDGHVVWVSLSASVVRNPEGHPLYYIAQIQDITERKLLEQRLEHEATHDPLTDLPNRTLFMDRLEHALSRAARHGSRMAILFMDLNDFKTVNDSLGHEGGDQLLVAIAERFKGAVRASDTLARFGGDEFAVLCEDVSDGEEVTKVAERIVQSLGVPFPLLDREVPISVSMGISCSVTNREKPEDLLRNADTALYRAKQRGTRYEVFDLERDVSNGLDAPERLQLKAQLRQAIEQEEFVLFYQPKVRLGEEDRIEDVEALIRWRHPQRGLVPAGEFIPFAERTGLIVPIGRWVFKEACCRQMKEWRERYSGELPTRVCVNVSAGQMRHPRFLEDVSSALRESGLEGYELVLEITESALMEDTEANEVLLAKLKELGVKLAIDDFGKGYSSFSYLKRLPVDQLKIDRFFLEDLEEDPNGTTIVGAMISLGHSLGLEIVAEGVETAKQLRHLKKMGCNYAQGYYFAKPLPSEAAERLLVEGVAH